RTARHLVDEQRRRESPVRQFVHQERLLAEVVMYGGGEYLGFETHVVGEPAELDGVIRGGVARDEHRNELVHSPYRLGGIRLVRIVTTPGRVQQGCSLGSAQLRYEALRIPELGGHLHAQCAAALRWLEAAVRASRC